MLWRQQFATVPLDLHQIFPQYWGCSWQSDRWWRWWQLELIFLPAASHAYVTLSLLSCAASRNDENIWYSILLTIYQKNVNKYHVVKLDTIVYIGRYWWTSLRDLWRKNHFQCQIFFFVVNLIQLLVNLLVETTQNQKRNNQIENKIQPQNINLNRKIDKFNSSC